MTAFSGYALRVAAAAVSVAAVSACSAGYSTAPSTLPVRVYQNMVYGQSAPGHPLTEDVYSPTADAGPAPVVIVVHGGGFTTGDKQGDSSYASAMASVGFLAVNVNYTLTTPHSRGYPQQVQEIQDAIRWSIAHARQFGGDPDQLAVVGFSAGGYLAAMAGLLDSSLPGRPVKAVVTLSAPLDLPAMDQLLRARVAACGYRPSCPQLPQAPTLSAFSTMFEFLGCPTGKCSTQLIRDASPTSHVTARAPAFQIFNSADELIPRSQATDMGNALRAVQVPAHVVIVQGNQHGESYLPDVNTSILTFLDQHVGAPRLRLTAATSPAPSSGTQTVLVACAIIAAASLGVVLLAMRRRPAGAPATGDATRMTSG